MGEEVYIRDYTGSVLTSARLMLHAATLGFEHPVTGARVELGIAVATGLHGGGRPARAPVVRLAIMTAAAIRLARASDVSTILRFIRALAEYCAAAGDPDSVNALWGARREGTHWR